MPRPTPSEAVSILSEAGIQATSQDQDVIVTTGHLSGNLACLCVNGGAAAVASLDPGVLAILGTPATFQSNGCTQYFYQCSQFERTRQLTEAVTIHGDPDTLIVYPSPAWSHISGTFRKLPMISWADHCRMVELILLDRPLQAMPQIAEADIAAVFGMMTLTQRNVAEAFIQVYHQDFRHCKAWGAWLEWIKDHWRTEITDLVFDRMVNLIHTLNPAMKAEPAKASFASGCERIARASRMISTRPGDWDRDTWLVNTPIETQELKELKLKPHDKNDYITKITNVSPARGPHPVFDRFMRDICLDDEALVNYHQRALGSCLSGAIQDNFLLFWYGTGQNGKNTLGELVEWIFGDYAKVIPAETLMVDKHGTRHPTDLANLRGVRLAISSEVEEGSYFNEQRIKSLTGDANISARFMRQDFFEFKRTHKHLIYGNHRPLLRIVDPALRARLHIVPFKAFFPPDARDSDLPRRLRLEAPQVMSWLIEGHQQWLEDGYLKKCSAVQAETDSYFEAQSTPDLWIQECCRLDPEFTVGASELYRSFKTWKESRGEGVMSATRLGEWLAQRYTKYRLDGYIRYRGLELKPQSVLDYRPN